MAGCGQYYQDPATGNCIDLNGNIVTPDVVAYTTDPSSIAASGTTAAGPDTTISDVSAIENDILTGFRALTQPNPIPAGQTGFSISGAKGGLSIVSSPLVLIAIIAVAVLVLRK
jgi:hypothetical protein